MLMMNYRVELDIKIICDYLSLSEKELAKEVGLPFETLSRIANKKINPSEEMLEKIYSFAYEKGIQLNSKKVDAYKKNQDVVLLHGAKGEIEGEISLEHSRIHVDLGKGFYTGDNYQQALDFVSHFPNSSVYICHANLKDLKILRLSESIDWMLMVALNRGMLEEFKNTKKYQQILDKCNSFDVIICPIADNRIFDSIEMFVNGQVTSEAAIKALNSIHIGDQIVFKTEKAIQNIKILERLYLCRKERIDSYKHKSSILEQSEFHVVKAYREYAKQGLSVLEVFKDE